MIQMFDDGSKAFKLLYSELKDKDVTILKMKDSLLESFTSADSNHKVYLHYTADDLRANHEDLRKQIEKCERVGFKNKIILAYEGMDNETVENRYRQLLVHGKPYVSETNTKFEREYNKKYLEQTGDNFKDIKLTGKPEAIAIDFPEVPKFTGDNDETKKPNKRKRKFSV